jgi:hypothetical protein
MCAHDGRCGKPVPSGDSLLTQKNECSHRIRFINPEHGYTCGTDEAYRAITFCDVGAFTVLVRPISVRFTCICILHNTLPTVAFATSSSSLTTDSGGFPSANAYLLHVTNRLLFFFFLSQATPFIYQSTYQSALPIYQSINQPPPGSRPTSGLFLSPVLFL